MKFSEKLNEYMTLLSCTAKELCSSYPAYPRPPSAATAAESACRSLGLSPGSKTSAAPLPQTAVAKEVPDRPDRSLLSGRPSSHCEDFVSTDKELLRQNFNALIAALDINLNAAVQIHKL